MPGLLQAEEHAHAALRYAPDAGSTEDIDREVAPRRERPSSVAYAPHSGRARAGWASRPGGRQVPVVGAQALKLGVPAWLYGLTGAPDGLTLSGFPVG